jgi:hypothetical protein
MFTKKIITSIIISLLIGISFGNSVFAEINTEYPNHVSIDAELDGQTLKVSWSKSDDPYFKRYHIIQSQTDEHPQYLDQETIWSTDNIDETNYDVEGLNESEPYYFRVCVNNTGNRSTCSNIIHVNKNSIVTNYPVYTDINSDAWYRGFVDDLQSKFILPVYDRTFEADKAITRGEFAEWIAKAIADEDEINPSSDYFCDVHVNKYINYLKELGVIEGYHGGNCGSRKLFKPNQTINRAEAVKLLLSVFKVKILKSEIEYAENFADSNIAVDVHRSQWFAPYIYWAQEDDIVDTNRRGYFRPETPINRAEAAKILSRAISKYK